MHSHGLMCQARSLMLNGDKQNLTLMFFPADLITALRGCP